MGDSRGNPIYTFDGDASRKIKIKSLRENSVKLTPSKTDIAAFFVNFFMQSPERYLNRRI